MNAEALQRTIVDNIDEFLDRALLRMETTPEKLPFKTAHGYHVAVWMKARLKDEIGVRFHLLPKAEG